MSKVEAIIMHEMGEAPVPQELQEFKALTGTFDLNLTTPKRWEGVVFSHNPNAATTLEGTDLLAYRHEPDLGVFVQTENPFDDRHGILFAHGSKREDSAYIYIPHRFTPLEVKRVTAGVYSSPESSTKLISDKIFVTETQLKPDEVIVFYQYADLKFGTKKQYVKALWVRHDSLMTPINKERRVRGWADEKEVPIKDVTPSSRKR